MSKTDTVCCENCGKYKAIKKDYRDTETGFKKLLVCEYCYNLNNLWFYKVRAEKLNPKELHNE